MFDQLQRGVDLTLRGGGDPAACRRHRARRVERAQRGGDNRQPQPQAGDQCRDRPMQLEAAVEDDARQRRKPFSGMSTGDGQHDVRTVAGRDYRDALAESLQHVIGRHSGDHHTHCLAAHQRGVTADQCAVHRGLQVGHRRCHQQRLIGHYVGLRPQRVQRLGHFGQLRRLAAVRHHRRGVRVLGVQLGQTHLDKVRDLLGTAALGPHRQEHRRAEVDRDPGVDAQLGGTGDVGVVAADDDDHVAFGGHRVIPLDDVVDGGVTVGVQLLIGHAEAALVGQSGGGLCQQQIRDVVAFLAEARNRPEHADPGDRRGQSMQDSQRDRRLAGVGLRRRDVDRRHRTGHHPCASQPSRRSRGSRSFWKSSRNRRWSWPGAWNTRWLRPQST